MATRTRMRLSIRGEAWQAVVLSDRFFKKKHGDIVAVALPEHRKIEFSRSKIRFCVVVHELFHAHASRLHLQSTNSINLDDAEEIFAEMTSQSLLDILRQATAILQFFKVPVTIAEADLSEQDKEAVRSLLG